MVTTTEDLRGLLGRATPTRLLGGTTTWGRGPIVAWRTPATVATGLLTPGFSSPAASSAEPHSGYRTSSKSISSSIGVPFSLNSGSSGFRARASRTAPRCTATSRQPSAR